MPRLAFAISGKKGFAVLKLAQSMLPDEIDRVYISSDKTLVDDYSNQIVKFAEHHKIRYFLDHHQQLFNPMSYVFAAGWRKRIYHPHSKLIIFHDSLLPRYRGFAPLINSLINKEKEIGVSAILGHDEFDRGDIIVQFKTAISYPLKIGEAIDLVSEHYGSAAEFVIKQLISKKNLCGVPQNESWATYSIWRNEDDYQIDWFATCDDIVRFVDALGHPYRGAFSYVDGQKITISAVEFFDRVNFELKDCGKIFKLVNGQPLVIASDGLILIKSANYRENQELGTVPVIFRSIRKRFT